MKTKHAKSSFALSRHNESSLLSTSVQPALAVQKFKVELKNENDRSSGKRLVRNWNARASITYCSGY